MAGTPTRCDATLVASVPQVGGSLCVIRNGLAPKTRQFVVLNGFTPSHNLGVYNNDVDAVVRALTERYFFCADGTGGFRKPLKVARGAFNHPALTAFRKSVCGNMPRLPRLTPPQVVSLYTGSKRRVYQAAMESLGRRPFCDGDALLSSFVKFEKQDVNKAPRVINPRSPRYNLHLARYLKHAEKHFYRAINKAYGGATPATVIKGFNADVSAKILRAKWDRFVDPVAIGLDAEKFDMHVSVVALLYEHSFYLWLYSHCPFLARLLKLQLRNTGTAWLRDGKVKFSINGSRSSGDINTSLGNCILMCALVYAYSSWLDVTVELANNGDDCVVFMERCDADKFRAALSSWFAVRGFKLTLEPTVDIFEQVEFCQTRPVLVAGRWRMVRNLRTSLMKDAMCLVSVPNQKTYRKWLYAVGECGSILCSGVPVLSAYYEMLKRHGMKCTDAFRDEVFRNRSQLQLSTGVASAPLTDSARVSFYYAFGVVPDAQVILERELARMRIEQIGNDIIGRCDLHLLPGVNIVAHL